MWLHYYGKVYASPLQASVNYGFAVAIMPMYVSQYCSDRSE